MQAGGSTAHTHVTHNRCVARRHMIQMVVAEDVLSLFYPDWCIVLNFPVPSTDQHLEGGHGRGREQIMYARLLFMGTKPASFSGC